MRFGYVTTAAPASCAERLSAAARRNLSDRAVAYAGEINRIPGDHYEYDQSLLDAARAKLERAVNVLNGAVFDGTYWCLSDNATRLVTNARVEIDRWVILATMNDQEVEAADAPHSGDNWPDYGPPLPDDWSREPAPRNADAEPSKIPGTGGGSPTGSRALMAPPSNALTVIGGLLLAGAAVVGIVALVKRGR